MYRIKLISVSNNELKNKTLNIYLKNDYYFGKISDTPPTISNVEEDIEIVPSGVQKNQKNYKSSIYKSKKSIKNGHKSYQYIKILN